MFYICVHYPKYQVFYFGKIAEQDYPAYPYASLLRGLREELFLIILSASAGRGAVGAEPCSAILFSKGDLSAESG